MQKRPVCFPKETFDQIRPLLTPAMSYSYSCIDAYTKNREIIQNNTQHSKQEPMKIFPDTPFHISGERDNPINSPFYYKRSVRTNEISDPLSEVSARNLESINGKRAEENSKINKSTFIINWVKTHFKNIKPFFLCTPASNSHHGRFWSWEAKNDTQSEVLLDNCVNGSVKNEIIACIKEFNLKIEEIKRFKGERTIQIDVTPLINNPKCLQELLSSLKILGNNVNISKVESPNYCNDLGLFKNNYDDNNMTDEIDESSLVNIRTNLRSKLNQVNDVCLVNFDGEHLKLMPQGNVKLNESNKDKFDVYNHHYNITSSPVNTQSKNCDNFSKPVVFGKHFSTMYPASSVGTENLSNMGLENNSIKRNRVCMGNQFEGGCSQWPGSNNNAPELSKYGNSLNDSFNDNRSNNEHTKNMFYDSANHKHRNNISRDVRSENSNNKNALRQELRYLFDEKEPNCPHLQGKVEDVILPVTKPNLEQINSVTNKSMNDNFTANYPTATDRAHVPQNTGRKSKDVLKLQQDFGEVLPNYCGDTMLTVTKEKEMLDTELGNNFTCKNPLVNCINKNDGEISYRINGIAYKIPAVNGDKSVLDNLSLNNDYHNVQSINIMLNDYQPNSSKHLKHSPRPKNRIFNLPNEKKKFSHFTDGVNKNTKAGNTNDEDKFKVKDSVQTESVSNVARNNKLKSKVNDSSSTSLFESCSSTYPSSSSSKWYSNKTDRNTQHSCHAVDSPKQKSSIRLSKMSNKSCTSKLSRSNVFVKRIRPSFLVKISKETSSNGKRESLGFSCKNKRPSYTVNKFSKINFLPKSQENMRIKKHAPSRHDHKSVEKSLLLAQTGVNNVDYKLKRCSKNEISIGQIVPKINSVRFNNYKNADRITSSSKLPTNLNPSEPIDNGKSTVNISCPINSNTDFYKRDNFDQNTNCIKFEHQNKNNFVGTENLIIDYRPYNVKSVNKNKKVTIEGNLNYNSIQPSSTYDNKINRQDGYKSLNQKSKLDSFCYNSLAGKEGTHEVFVCNEKQIKGNCHNSSSLAHKYKTEKINNKLLYKREQLLNDKFGLSSNLQAYKKERLQEGIPQREKSVNNSRSRYDGSIYNEKKTNNYNPLNGNTDNFDKQVKNKPDGFYNVCPYDTVKINRPTFFPNDEKQHYSKQSENIIESEVQNICNDSPNKSETLTSVLPGFERNTFAFHCSESKQLQKSNISFDKPTYKKKLSPQTSSDVNEYSPRRSEFRNKSTDGQCNCFCNSATFNLGCNGRECKTMSNSDSCNNKKQCEKECFIFSDRAQRSEMCVCQHSVGLLDNKKQNYFKNQSFCSKNELRKGCDSNNFVICPCSRSLNPELEKESQMTLSSDKTYTKYKGVHFNQEHSVEPTKEIFKQKEEGIKNIKNGTTNSFRPECIKGEDSFWAFQSKSSILDGQQSKPNKINTDADFVFCRKNSDTAPFLETNIQNEGTLNSCIDSICYKSKSGDMGTLFSSNSTRPNDTTASDSLSSSDSVNTEYEIVLHSESDSSTLSDSTPIKLILKICKHYDMSDDLAEYCKNNSLDRCLNFDRTYFENGRTGQHNRVSPDNEKSVQNNLKGFGDDDVRNLGVVINNNNMRYVYKQGKQSFCDVTGAVGSNMGEVEDQINKIVKHQKKVIRENCDNRSRRTVEGDCNYIYAHERTGVSFNKSSKIKECRPTAIFPSLNKSMSDKGEDVCSGKFKTNTHVGRKDHFQNESTSTYVIKNIKVNKNCGSVKQSSSTHVPISRKISKLIDKLKKFHKSSNLQNDSVNQNLIENLTKEIYSQREEISHMKEILAGCVNELCQVLGEE